MRGCYFHVPSGLGVFGSVPLLQQVSDNEKGPEVGLRYSSPDVTAGAVVLPFQDAQTAWLVGSISILLVATKLNTPTRQNRRLLQPMAGSMPPSGFNFANVANARGIIDTRISKCTVGHLTLPESAALKLQLQDLQGFREAPCCLLMQQVPNVMLHTMTCGSTTKVQAQRVLKYHRISNGCTKPLLQTGQTLAVYRLCHTFRQVH